MANATMETVESGSNEQSSDEPSRVSFREGRLARRKAEEAAVRRFEAASWLESVAGPLGLSTERPTDQEFISSLRSGLVLCRAINKVKPGAVPKVVANPSVGSAWDLQPLPAYQYFQNVRNFLAAVRKLQLPDFEASDIERETIEVISAVKIVDCILALKSFHEFRKATGGSYTPLKHAKSPLISESSSQFWSTCSASPVNPRRLEMKDTPKKEQSAQHGRQGSQDAMDSLVKTISTLMFDCRENIDQSLLDSWNEGQIDPVSLFSEIMSRCLGGKQLEALLNALTSEGKMAKKRMLSDLSHPHKLEAVLNALPSEGNMLKKSESSRAHKYCKLCIQKGNRFCCCLLEVQEKEVMDLRTLLSKTRMDFIYLRSQLQNDFTQLESQIKSMPNSASGYGKAFKENKHLYNVLKKLNGHIQVFCRIRPIYSGANSSIENIGNDGSLMISDPLNPQNGREIFQFNKVFGPLATQDEVYKETQNLIGSVMDGYNVCIFACGQRGSGKTHTMWGLTSELGKEMGLNYMALNDLFRISNVREKIKYQIRVQMIEICNEEVHDLLLENAVNTNLDRRTCSNNSLSLPEASMQLVQSTDDFLNLVKLGEKNRAFGSVLMNDRSSHSHSVLTVHVNGKDISGDTISSCLHLVDLTCSERVDKSETIGGDRLSEAQHIHKSLSCLEDVITALSLKSSHISYQNSKLTQMLQNSLGQNAKMLILAHVSPEGDSYEETMNTLNFAQRASTIELRTAHLNKESNEIRGLKNQIDSLKKALTMNEWEKDITQHKMQENTPVLERPKQMERTPPRPRRLSIDDGGSRTGTAANANDRKMLKSPVSRSKFMIDRTPPISNWRISSEGSTSEINKRTLIYSDSNTRIPTEHLSERNISCAQLDLLGGKELKTSSSNQKFVSGIEAFSESPYTSSTVFKNGLPNLDSTPRPHLLERSPVIKRNLNETTPAKSTSVIRSHLRSSSNNPSSKGGMQIKKSIQNIGKLINGSVKRNTKFPSETPSKSGKDAIFDSKSPILGDVRLRRQSLTSIETMGLNMTKKSIGGKASDSNSNSSQTSRTPPPVHSSVRATKKWL